MESEYYTYSQDGRNHLVTIDKNLQARPLICINPACKNYTHRKPSNHWLQENGVLSHIANADNKVRWCERDFYNKEFRFKPKGIGDKVFKFRAFCNDCDSRLFKSIEQSKPDFNDPNTHFLFYLRAFIHEKTKHRHNYELYKKFEEEINEKWSDLKASHNIAGKEFVDIHSTKERWKLLYDIDCKYEKQTFPDYTQHSNKIMGKHKKLPSNEELACSGFISRCSNDGQIFSNFAFHLLPFEDETILYMQTDHQSIYNHLFAESYLPYVLFQYMHNLDENELMKYISDIIICFTEDWALSDNFYNTYIKDRHDHVLEILTYGATMDEKVKRFPDLGSFNLFTVPSK